MSFIASFPSSLVLFDVYFLRAARYADLPAWAYSLWFYVLFSAIVVGLIMAGARAIHLYVKQLTRRRLAETEHVVQRQTEHLQQATASIQGENEELSWTNDELMHSNDSLQHRNETLSWINNQLTGANIALERRTAELRRALEENKEILGITAHDLKNPLGGIIGLANIILEDLKGLPEEEAIAQCEENTALIKETAEEMLRSVQNLLDRHRLGLPARLNKEVADLEMIAELVVKWNRQPASKKNIQLSIASPGHGVSVLMDVSAIQRVIDNLISNAVKYSPGGTKICIEVELLERRARVCVRDEGPGLTDEDKKRVFGKMARLSARPTGGEHSTGLGLFIVKKLVEEHGGRVGVRSEYGQGATFWFELPLVAENHVDARG